MFYKLTFEDGSEAIAHYGVKGMKWDQHVKAQDPAYLAALGIGSALGVKPGMAAEYNAQNQQTQTSSAGGSSPSPKVKSAVQSSAKVQEALAKFHKTTQDNARKERAKQKMREYKNESSVNRDEFRGDRKGYLAAQAQTDAAFGKKGKAAQAAEMHRRRHNKDRFEKSMRDSGMIRTKSNNNPNGYIYKKGTDVAKEAASKRRSSDRKERLAATAKKPKLDASKYGYENTSAGRAAARSEMFGEKAAKGKMSREKAQDITRKEAKSNAANKRLGSANGPLGHVTATVKSASDQASMANTFRSRSEINKSTAKSIAKRKRQESSDRRQTSQHHMNERTRQVNQRLKKATESKRSKRSVKRAKKLLTGL